MQLTLNQIFIADLPIGEWIGQFHCFALKALL